MMNHRERVLTALRHQEPDRVPIDVGGTDVSMIMAVPYVELRKHLHLGAGTIRVPDPYQMVATVEEDVRRALGGDTMFVFHEPREWRKGTLADGSPAEFPGIHIKSNRLHIIQYPHRLREHFLRHIP